MMLLNSLDQWFAYFGHFHPVIVHLPIGILILAFIIELVSRKNKSNASPQRAVSFMLGMGCTSAVFSCVVGWLLSKQGSYDENTLMLHQWMGIGVALVSGVCWWMKQKKNATFKKRSVYGLLLTALFVMLVLTGHNGGSMTHGDDYLTAELPEWLIGSESKDTTVFVRKTIANVNEAYVFTDLVQNILADKCYSCHSSKKVKGGLRVDNEKLLFKGGKHGIVIKPGDADESELITRILLPEEDNKRMPPEKQEQLTQEEIALLKWWVQNGADTKKKVKEFTTVAEIMPMLASFAASPGKDSSEISPLSKIFDTDLPPADQKILDTLTRLGILVQPVAKSNNLLEISCINYPGFNDNTMPLLLKVADHIVSLKLDGTQITDGAFTAVSQFRNLVHLNIANTTVSNTAMAKIQPLQGLEYLNIVGTKVGNEGLQHLQALPALKRVYCWNSLVTDKGLTDFNQKKNIVVGRE